MSAFPFVTAPAPLDEAELAILRKSMQRHSDPGSGLWLSKPTPDGAKWLTLRLPAIAAPIDESKILGLHTFVRHLAGPHQRMTIIDPAGFYEKYVDKPMDIDSLVVSAPGALSLPTATKESGLVAQFLLFATISTMGEDGNFVAEWVDGVLIRMEPPKHGRSQTRLAGEPVDGRPTAARSPTELPPAPLRLLIGFADTFAIAHPDTVCASGKQRPKFLDYDFVVAASPADAVAWVDTIRALKGDTVTVELDPLLKV